MVRKLILVALVVLVALPASHAVAGKKKKPKPYKSEEVTVMVPHPLFYGNTESVNSVTAKEFEMTCAEPGSQGFDGWVFAVPAAWQKMEAEVSAIGVESEGFPVANDLDFIVYNESCEVTFASQSVGGDEIGYMPAGTAWIFVHVYEGAPETTLHIEIKSL